MNDLYASGWNPAGSRKTWDRCSMDVASTTKLLGVWAERAGGKVVEAVGWFDDDGATRILVADFDNGKRIDVRFLSRGHRITFSKTPIRQVAA